MTSPSKLFSCVDSANIVRSPINNSTAKHSWSFSKSPRFKTTKTIYCDKIYDLPNTIVRRSTSFGLGKKTDLGYDNDPHNGVPSPDTYNIKNFTEENELHNCGFNIRLGREKTEPMSYIKLEQARVPGPGAYMSPKYKDTPEWSLRKRTQTYFFPLTTSTTQKIVPGPGTHAIQIALHPYGKYHLGRFKNSLSKIWNPKRSKRFHVETNGSPGPGTYEQNNNLSSSGHYVLSTNKSDGKRFMPTANRGSFVYEPAKLIDSPGPGKYRTPSEFGIYDHLKECRHPSSRRINRSMTIDFTRKE